MIRKFALVFVVLALVLAGCGGGDDDDAGGSGDVTTAANAETCEQLGSVFGNAAQNMLDGLSDLSMTDLSSLSAGDSPEALTTFQTDMTKISSRSDELQCSDEDLASIFKNEVDDLEANGPVPELILQSLQQDAQGGDILNPGN